MFVASDWMKAFSHAVARPFGGAVCVIALGGCAATTPEASEPSWQKAKDQASAGAAVFSANCASCHGERGEGRVTGPRIIGGGALPVFPRDRSTSSQFTDVTQQQRQAKEQLPGSSRGPFHTANDLHQYVSTRMPQPANRAGTLPAADYWAVTNFILIAHGAEVPAGGVNADNASSVSIEPR